MNIIIAEIYFHHNGIEKSKEDDYNIALAYLDVNLKYLNSRKYFRFDRRIPTYVAIAKILEKQDQFEQARQKLKECLVNNKIARGTDDPNALQIIRRISRLSKKIGENKQNDAGV